MNDDPSPGHSGSAQELITRALENPGCFEALFEQMKDPVACPFPAEVRARALNWLGHTLVQMERFEQAAPCFEEALTVPDDPVRTAERHNNLGMVLGQLGEYEEELQCYERALALMPAPLTHLNLSLAILRLGNFAQGWREYEHRWGEGAPQWTARRSFPQPLWGGSDISGRRLLLYAEQGLGDTLQFVRYVPKVIERGARVILEVQPSLKQLLSGLPDLTALVAGGEPLPEFDLQCPLLSLPLVFRTTLETIPRAIPYLHAGQEARQVWTKRLGEETRFKVGIVWSGSPHHNKDRTRSLPAECMGPLLALRGASFYSFQVGERSIDCHHLETFGPLQDLSPLLTDFSETAAALAQMDVLISVDTAMAHLGGALGLETWLLLPAVADWRWMVDRTDSPWYPTLSLFRQETRGDWDSVVKRVRTELQARLEA
jgi:tetratricopeptide (TPR) repeat protein